MYICCLKRLTLVKDACTLKWKGQEKMLNVNGNPRAQVGILLLDMYNAKEFNSSRKYTLNIGASKYIKQTL